MSIEAITLSLEYTIGLLPESDSDVKLALAGCIKQLNSISWERFRQRHEAASKARIAARRRTAFVQRHRRVRYTSDKQAL